MATRQTAGQPAKGGRAAQGRTGPGRGPAKGTAAAARGGAGASGSSGKQSAVSTAKRQPAAEPARSGVGAAWHGVVGWAGGGLPLATLIVSVLGVADSVYLVIDHFTGSALAACPENATINCAKVTTSAWSYLPAGPVSWSVPVSVLGLAFFVFMVLINSPWGWRAPWAAVHWVRLASVCVGMVMVLYLVWAELFRINAICLYCTGVHLLTFILFGLVVSMVAFSGVKAVPARH